MQIFRYWKQGKNISKILFFLLSISEWNKIDINIHDAQIIASFKFVIYIYISNPWRDIVDKLFEKDIVN